MSSFSDSSLSKFQRGILTEIGISQWKLEDSDRIAQEQALVAKRAAEIISESPGEQVSESETESTPNVVAERPIAESPTKNSESGSQIISMPDKVLFAWSESQLPNWFTQDVLLALGQEENTPEYIDSESAHQYQDYALLCTCGEQLDFDGKRLTIPVDKGELSPKLKKALWESLAHHHDH